MSLLVWNLERKALSYVEHLLTYLLLLRISEFTSVVGIPVAIASSEVALQICVTTARIKNYKLMIK